jgi:hypothetical protein
MHTTGKLKHELTTMAVYTAFFAVWFLAAMLLKFLVLAEYEVRFFHLTAALVGALILAKVVLVMEHVPVARWLGDCPAWLIVIVRTILYGLGVLLLLLLEKAFESRHEQGGFVAALLGVLRHEDIPHVLATALSTTGALLVFNAQSVIKAHLGEFGLARLFLSPLPGGEKRD